MKTLQKPLKRNKFDVFDSSMACVCFILLMVLVKSLLSVLPFSIARNSFMYFIVEFVVEAVFFVAVVITASIRNVKIFEATKLNKKFDWVSLLISFALAIICLIGFTQLTNVFTLSLENIGYQSKLPPIKITNFGIYIGYVICFCIAPAIFEETLFRGCILNGLQKIGKHKSIIVSSIIFMLMHGGPDQTVHQFIIGMILGYTYIYSGSIWPSVIIHFLNNFTSVTLIYITSGVESVETVPGASWSYVLVVLAVAIIMAAIAGYLCYLCFKVLKKQKDKREVENVDATTKNENLLEDKNQNEINGNEQNKANENNTKQEKLNLNKYAIIMFCISGAYLVINWVLTLINGFMK